VHVAKDGRGIKMMNAAMLMLASVKQMGASPVSADLFANQAKPEGVSFEKSFNDRIGESALLEGKSSPKESAVELTGLKAAVPAKKSDAVAEMLDEAKGKTIGVQEMPAYGKLESAAAYKVVASEAAVGTGSRDKIAAGDSTAKNIASPVDGIETADEISFNSSTFSAPPAAGLTGRGFALPVSIADEARPLVSSANSPLVQKEAENIGKTKEIASAKKIAKAQENPATSKPAQKAVGADGNAASKPALAISTEDAGPIFHGVVAGVVVPRSDDDKTTSDGFNLAALKKTNALSEVTPATVSGSISNETGHDMKTAAVDTGTAVTSPDGQLAVPKSGADLEKTATIAGSAGNDGDSKTQTASGPAIAMVHSIGGSIAPGATPMAGVPGNTPGESTAAKLPVANHSTGLSIESREQDRAGVVSASVDEMPRMLTATPTALEVGIQNGTHGWLKVRAEMAEGGVVNASVSAASSTGQEMLHRELPALAAYLQEEKVAVNAIVVHTPLATGSELRSATGTDSAGGQSPQRGSEGGEQQQSVKKAISNGLDEVMSYESVRGVEQDGSLSLATHAGGGNWLSVRA
jgi:hypothetical protein